MKLPQKELRLRAAATLLANGFSKLDCIRVCRIQHKDMSDIPSQFRENNDERNADMVRRYREGETLEQIGVFYNITRERVRQILRHVHGVAASEGGAAIRALSNHVAEGRERQERRDQKALHVFGCDYDTLIRLNDGVTLTMKYGTKTERFYNQKAHAGTRGIDWQLSFPEWVEIWMASGKWEKRGRGKDRYCMSRRGDVGPYSKDNVEIITNAQNSSDSYLKVSAEERKAKARYSYASPDGLSVRQREILNLWNEGKNRSEIGELLGIKGTTVGVHLSSIHTKLKGDGRAVEEEAAA